MVSAISAKKLTRTFGNVVAVDAIDLEVPEGALFGFLGLNGAGKSTTIRMLCGLLPPSSGEARVCGFDVEEDVLDVRRRVGLIADLEAAQAHPSWTGQEYLAYFARLWDAPEPAARVHALLEQVGLPVAWRRRPMGSYSTGMRRRVEVARAMLGDPRVLFLDEPTRGLDLPAKREMWEWLRTVAGDASVTIFLSSHEVPEIRALCEDLAVIASGRIAYEGPAKALGHDEASFEDALLRLLRGEAPPSKPSWVVER